MSDYSIRSPSASIARGIENLIIKGNSSRYFAVKSGCEILSRLISVTVFPIFLSLELVFKRVPKLLQSIPYCSEDHDKAVSKFQKNLHKIKTFCLGILFCPIGILSSDAMLMSFLKTPAADKVILPFGVEQQYGKKVQQVYYPTTIQELQELVRKAKQEKKQISIIGAGMSQGPQTVPVEENSIVINTKKLNHIVFGQDNNTVKVQAGATWENIQIEANQRGKSVIVKQASDIFSVGGSIGINCHGWAHEYGSIASTVESLEVIDANGDLKTLTPKDELFGCMFGTLGYFGIVVSATLKMADNEYLIEKAKEVDLDDFTRDYEEEIKGHDIPLFRGRLVLDNLDGDPLRKVFMVRYEREAPISDTTPPFKAEPKYGSHIERIALQALSHLPYFATRRLISMFWNNEKDAMFSERRMTRNEALHPPINAFKILHKSNLHAQWLQEYFITKENLPNFLRFLGAELKANKVRLINATIRPTPKDSISILPYAEQDRYAVVICFGQLKTEKEIERTKHWMKNVNDYVIQKGDVYYQAYMPYTTQEDFIRCYGQERIKKLRELKKKYDPDHIFGNGHTKKYFDINLKVH